MPTFGGLLTFNPHIHVLAADGVFRADGVFVVLPAIPVKLLEQGFRCEVLKLLVAEGAIGERLSASMLAWRHSGFSVHNGVRAAAGDTKLAPIAPAGGGAQGGEINIRPMWTVQDRFKHRIAARQRAAMASAAN